MKLTLITCCLTVLALTKPVLCVPRASIAVQNIVVKDTPLTIQDLPTESLVPDTLAIDQVNVSKGYTKTLYDLLGLDENSVYQEQTNMVLRILDSTSNCESVKMLCQIDGLLRHITRDVHVSGVTDVVSQVDLEKFAHVLDLLFSTMNKDDVELYYPGASIANSKSWQDRGAEYQAFMELATEFQSLLAYPQKFTPSKIVSPFLLNDKKLKKQAIQKLIDSPAFRLNSLEEDGQFFRYMNSIMSQVIDQENLPVQNVTISLDDMVVSAASLPELNSSDVEVVNAVIDKANGELIQYNIEEQLVTSVLLRSFLGDILGVLFDLPGKLSGLGGRGGSDHSGGLTITISFGIPDEDEEDSVKHKPMSVSALKKPSPTTKRSASPTATVDAPIFT